VALPVEQRIRRAVVGGDARAALIRLRVVVAAVVPAAPVTRPLVAAVRVVRPARQAPRVQLSQVAVAAAADSAVVAVPRRAPKCSRSRLLKVGAA
jgi:hypothetical protein